MEKPKFRERSEEEYSSLRTSELFSMYLYTLTHEDIHPADMDKKEKFAEALFRRPLAERYDFYKSLPVGPAKSLYKAFLISK